MRTRFDQQLELLNQELTQMGALCEYAISVAAKAFLDNDKSLLPAVFSADSEIDQKERDIESLCLKLLLQQQPVAKDLRVISSAMKIGNHVLGTFFNGWQNGHLGCPVNQIIPVYLRDQVQEDGSTFTDALHLHQFLHRGIQHL